jgi:hypothetical protein
MELLRVAWRTVGSIVTRVNAEIDKSIDRLEGLRRIGIDEISYKRGHRYLIVVVDHDRGHLVWAGPGRNDTALNVFFDELGPERSALLTHVSADMADWIARVVAQRAPNATRSADPFHVVAWAIDALDIERRRAWNEAKGRHSTRDVGRRPDRATGDAKHIAQSRYALWKNPGDLTGRQRPNSTGSPRPPHDSGARTSSKKDCATSSRSKAKKAESRSTDGSNGRAAPASPRSCTSNAASVSTATRSTPHSTPASPKASSNPPTPRSDYSPASHSGSTATNPSSPSPCSPSEHNHPASPAEHDPRMQQENQIWREARRGSYQANTGVAARLLLSRSYRDGHDCAQANQHQ